MYGVCLFWDGGRVRFGQVEAMQEAVGGWCFAAVPGVVFPGGGWHKPAGVQGEPVPRLDSHLAVLVYLNESAEACASFVLGFFSGYATGANLPISSHRLAPSIN